jgi:hypothetical protein
VHVGKFGVSSLAVVGQMGVLLGNISITDVSTASATSEKISALLISPKNIRLNTLSRAKTRSYGTLAFNL